MCHLNFIVVSANGIADRRMLLVFLRQFHTHDGVRFFQFFRPYFSDVVQQAGTFGLLNIKAKFRGHDGAQVGYFA